MLANPDAPAYQRAVDNLRGAVEFGNRLPNNVFRSAWSEFLFFDPSVLFHEDVIFVFESLRKSENSTYCCLRRVPNTDIGARSSESFAFDASVTFEAYSSQIRDRDPVERALVRLDRFAATSDVGDWCLYAEAQEDMGVLALKKSLPPSLCGAAIEKLRALPLRRLLQLGNAAPHVFSHLVPHWREGLMQHYASSV